MSEEEKKHEGCCGGHHEDGHCCSGHDHGHDEHHECCGGGHEHGDDHECCGGHGHDDGHEGSCCCGHHHHTPSDGEDQVRMFVVGQLQTNCYAYISQGECLVVDPGASGVGIAKHLEDVRIKSIVATHGHGDHVGGVLSLQRVTGARFMMHEADVELASHAGEASEQGRTYDNNAPAPDQLLCEGDVIELGTARFRVIEAPGHTPGGIVLLGEGTALGLAFVGDTLFKGSCGRTDLAGGSHELMMQTLARLKELVPAHTTLLCGHGDITTMEDELAYNPWLQDGVVSDGIH